LLLCACAAVIFFSCPRSFFWASSRGGKIKDLKTPKVSRPPKTSLGLVSWLAHFSARHRQSSRARLKRSADTRKRTLRVLLDLVCSVPSCTYAPSSLVTSPLFISPLHLLSAEDLLQRNSSSLPPLLPFRCFLLARPAGCVAFAFSRRRRFFTTGQQCQQLRSSCRCRRAVREPRERRLRTEACFWTCWTRARTSSR
jgi:hypothetical protein